MMRSWRIYPTKHGGRDRAIAKESHLGRLAYGDGIFFLCSALSLCFFMARIATCRCGLEFYDSAETRTLCNRCAASPRETEAKLQRLKKQFGSAKNSENPYDLNWAVIQCHWREGLSISQMAKVLGVDAETIGFEIDIAIQNSR